MTCGPWRLLDGDLLIGATALLAVATPAPADPIDEVPSGTMLDSRNWQIAKGLLPDQILRFYERGDYADPSSR